MEHDNLVNNVVEIVFNIRELVEESKRIPLTYDVLIDQREMIRLLDALEKGVRMVTMRHSLANKNAGFSENNLIT